MTTYIYDHMKIENYRKHRQYSIHMYKCFDILGHLVYM